MFFIMFRESQMVTMVTITAAVDEALVRFYNRETVHAVVTVSNDLNIYT